MLSVATGQRSGCRSNESTARSRPLNHAAPCWGARSTTYKYSSSSSASAFLAKINAICLACGAADRTLGAQAWCDQP